MMDKYITIVTSSPEDNVFEIFTGDSEETDTEYTTEYSGYESEVIQRLDTIIEYDKAIHFGIYSLTGLAMFVVVIRVLWTLFDKWFFGGV